MRRALAVLGALAGVLSIGLGVTGAAADVSDNCYDQSTDIGVPGPVGVGYEGYRDNTYSANAQHICYRVYNPLNGTKITGGAIKPYQYDASAPTFQSGGVQCLPDSSAATPLPFCYLIYGAGVGVTSSSVTAGGYAGGTPATTVESYNNGVHGIAVPSATETPAERRVTATAPSVCAGTSQPTPTGGCVGGVTVTAAVAKNDLGLRGSPPTGVETNNSATPLVSVNVAGIPHNQDLPGSCVGVC